MNPQINLDLGIDANIADIIEKRAENYGYNEYFYIGDKAIRMFSMNKYTLEKELNDNFENCKCDKCPFAKKNNQNTIMKYKKNNIFIRCNCLSGLKEYYDYFSETEMWTRYIILEINCKICRKIYKNRDANKYANKIIIEKDNNTSRPSDY
jgi:hypothetical protein